MIKAIRWGLLIISALSLVACGQRTHLAPVMELQWQGSKTPSFHVVRRGETLYAIAFHYDEDYRKLAALNHMAAPYTLRIGQRLRLLPLHKKTVPSSKATTSRRIQQKVSPPSKPYQKLTWLWPVHGRVVRYFAPQQGKKGIHIAGKKGDSIRAAQAGVVAYAGNGLNGYGNLIIIKHDNHYLTAYGNNYRNLVKEGQHVAQGQKIAEMGVVDRRYWGLHFEIRKTGKPVNPLNYLQKG